MTIYGNPDIGYSLWRSLIWTVSLGPILSILDKLSSFEKVKVCGDIYMGNYSVFLYWISTPGKGYFSGFMSGNEW